MLILKNLNSDSLTHQSDSPTWRLAKFSFKHSKATSPTRRVADSPSRGVVFRLRISPRMWSQNRNGSKGIVRDLWEPISAKNPENPPHCHVLLIWVQKHLQDTFEQNYLIPWARLAAVLSHNVPRILQHVLYSSPKNSRKSFQPSAFQNSALFVIIYKI